MQPVRHLYVHVPFCPRVCPYCSFYVLPADRRAVPGLIDALLAELRHRAAAIPLEPRTLFLGGGTPSALATRDLARLLEALPRPGPGGEFTIEINPTTVSLEKARLLRALGANRASLGAQSFDPAVLATLGRQHDPARIRASFAILREAGFANINLDLMFAVPGQSAASWDATLSEAIAMEPEHISAYCLTFEEDTPFFESLKSRRFHRDPDLEARLFLATRERLAAAGILPYEVSNFARPGFEAAHNLACWRGHDYLGLGPSAVSTVGARRWKNIPDLAAYLDGAAAGVWPEVEAETLTPELRERERVIFGLRTREGVATPAHSRAFAELTAAGCAVKENGRWRLTPDGLLRADAIAGMFLE